MRLLIIALVGLTIACSRTYITVPSPTAPTTDTKPAVITSTIQFRVTGNANSVKVRYSTERDGLIQTTTTLPFFTSFTTTSDNLFLSLEVTPVSFSQVTQFPFLSAQVLVNGNLFREATSNDFILNTITVNGTWRR